jgi:hypothetical protein
MIDAIAFQVHQFADTLNASAHLGVADLLSNFSRRATSSFSTLRDRLAYPGSNLSGNRQPAPSNAWADRGGGEFYRQRSAD